MQKSDQPHRGVSWQYLYLLILLPCLVYTVLCTARAIKLDYTAVPMWDSWRSVQYVDELFRFDLGYFWVQHNEHRIVFPEIVYALDYVFFRGVQILPIACNIVLQLVQLGFLWRLLWRMETPAAPFRLVLGAGCALLMTCVMQVQGFLGTFELQWYLSGTAAMVACWSLWSAARTGRRASLAVLVIAAVIATYTTGNGMLIWLVLILLAVLLRLPWRRTVMIAAAGVVTIATYFAGYTFMSPGRTMLFVTHPFYAIWYTGVFLGTPLSYLSVDWGGIAGLAGVGLAVLAVVMAFRQGRLSDPGLITAGVCLYIGASALMVAYGRMNPGDPAVKEALAERYVSVPLMFWANLLVTGAWLMAQLARGRDLAQHAGAALLTLFLLVTVVDQQKSHERAFAAEQASAEETGTALAAGIDDPDLKRVVFPDPGFISDILPGIRRRRLSIFASGRQDWIGKGLNSIFTTAPRERSAELCSGALETLTGVTGGYRVEGWAWDREADRPARDIVLTSAEIITGFGETRPGGFPLHNPARRLASDRDWVGFAQRVRMPGTLQAYAIVGGKMACALGPPLRTPRVTPMGPKQVGAPIHMATWKADAAWTRNGFHPSVGMLSGEVLYGSYSGSDANEGVLTSAPFNVAGHGCIAIPAAHGPSSDGQSIRLVDAENGKTVEEIPLSGTAGAWQYWAIELEGAVQLQIVAADNGKAWGQWLAVGEPHWCQP